MMNTMRNLNLPKTVYSPDSCLRNPLQLMREMIADLAISRELAWRLFVRNISAQYRQSLFGYFWAIVPPLLTMLIWVFLNSQKIIQVESPGVPYPVFVLVGTVLWQTFVDALNSPLRIVSQSKGLLSKVNFPREALILAGLAEVLFNFLLRCALLAGMFVWFRAELPSTVLLALPGVLALIVLGLMFGLLLTPFGMLYGDVGRGVPLMTQLWFFLTPVIYPLPQQGLPALVANLNPVTPVLVTTREWLTVGGAAHAFGFCVVTSTAIVFLLFGWLLYRIAMPHLIERMSA